MANSNDATIVTNSNVRPRQVLLVGLGGIGSRTVDNILSVMPEEFRKYTKAIALDTDLEELSKRIYYIPEENRIALGSNPDNGQSVTVGEYIRNHPDTMDWFVKGGKLNTIEKRNTAQGAKQIRMVSRIALAATDEFCGMKKRLEDILQDLNSADGTTLSQGLLVMVVCSVAGGTGAGTVLQFPLYLEQALAKSFSDENVQMECAMLLPNIFSRAQDMENQTAARANAYAVVRELMSMNSGRLKRGDILPNCDFEEKSENISPYGRVMFFDDVSMSGDSIEQDLDRVYVPKIANALNEYLFGSVSGKITSALDNTLSRVYRTGGAAIFSSVGAAKLKFPRATYHQYALSQWITKAISESWLNVDKEANMIFRERKRNAIENDLKRLDESDRREIYCECIDQDETPFYRELKRPMTESSQGLKQDLVTVFVNKCLDYIEDKIENDEELNGKISKINSTVRANGDHHAVESAFKALEAVADKLVFVGEQYEIKVAKPAIASEDSFYNRDNKDETYLFAFIRNRKLHPIMIRYFIYKLYNELAEYTLNDAREECKYNELKSLRSKDYKARCDKFIRDIKTNAADRAMAAFAKKLRNDLEEYMLEIEGLFDNLVIVLEKFEDSKKRSLSELRANDPKTGNVLAGGPLSMMYSWKQVESQLADGDDPFMIDDNLNVKMHELVYSSFIDQVTGEIDKQQSPDGSRIRVRTKYDKLVYRDLQVYYSKILDDSYTMCFPQNVVEAALLECGLINAYNDAKSRADKPQLFTFDFFMSRGPKPLNYALAKDAPEGMVSDAQYMSSLMSAAVANSKPYCGRVDDNAGEKGIINRLLVANNRILRTKVDVHNVDEYGIAGHVYIEDELIDGVSTSRIGSVNVNSKFVPSGITMDEMAFVTTIAGLQPFNFVAFLPPDNDEHAPTKASTYYMSYIEHVENVALRSDFITPHLHRDWHMAGVLEDFTEAHTETYSKSAAEAFAYGFIFDVISVSSDGSVDIGQFKNSYFAKVFGETGVRTFNLLDDTLRANLDVMSADEKRSALNTTLVKLFELLATSHPIRDAIIAYSENKISEYNQAKSADFIRMCLNSEKLSDVNYDCILDVFDGYYNGINDAQFNERDAAKKNIGYMFTLVMENIFEMCKLFSNEPQKIKALYVQMVKKLYDATLCDEYVDADEVEFADDDSIESIIRRTTNYSVGQATKVFAREYSQKVAVDMIDIFLKK